MTEREAIKLLSEIRDSEYVKYMGIKTAVFNEKAIEAFDLAISALEKQSVDKCCETCKNRSRLAQEIPCCDCYMASCFEDCYEPYTEEEE